MATRAEEFLDAETFLDGDTHRGSAADFLDAESFLDAPEEPRRLAPGDITAMQFGVARPSQGRLKSGLSSLAQGAGQSISGLPKSLALLNAPDPFVLRNLERIDRGQPYVLRFQPGALGPGGRPPSEDPNEALYREYQAASPEQRQAIRARWDEQYNRAVESPLFEAGNAIDRWIAEHFPVNPQFQDEFWTSKVPQALGSATGFAATALIGRGALRPLGSTARTVGTFAVPAELGSAMNRIQTFEDALQSGSDIATALDASKVGALIGTSEAIPIGHLLTRLDKVSGGAIKRMLVRAIQQGTEEGLQETFSGILNEAVAQRMYDPTRGIWTLDRAEEGAVGFTTGALLEMLATIALPGRRRGHGGAPPSQEAEQHTPEEVTAFARDRLASLEAMGEDVTEAQADERDFLRQNPTPRQVAETYGVQLREPQSSREQARANVPSPSPADIESPLPTDLIQEGKEVIEEALASQGSDEEIAGLADELRPFKSPDSVTIASERPDVAANLARITDRLREIGREDIVQMSRQELDTAFPPRAQTPQPTEVKTDVRETQPIEAPQGQEAQAEGAAPRADAEGAAGPVLSAEELLEDATEPPARETASLDERLDAFADERQAMRDRGETDSPIYDAMGAATLPGFSLENAQKAVITAIEQGRDDLADAIIERAERSAEKAAQAKPGVSPDSPKYEAIKESLEQRAREAREQANQLRRLAELRRGERGQPTEPVTVREATEPAGPAVPTPEAQLPAVATPESEMIAQTIESQTALPSPTTEAPRLQGPDEGAPLADMGFRYVEASRAWAKTVRESENREHLFNVRHLRDGRWRVTQSTRFPGTSVTGTPARLVGEFANAQQAAEAVGRATSSPQQQPDPAPRGTTPAPQEIPETAKSGNPDAAAAPPLRVEDFKEKSIIIRGQTKENIERIKAAGKAAGIRALWNRKAGGWIFPKAREAQVREALADLLQGQSAAGQGLRGRRIDDEWVRFAPDSGTLNIPRDDMPQIKAEHRGALANFLKARGIDGTEADVPASSLKPTQAEFSEKKVEKAKAFTGGDRAILVSSDGYVLDGHHQWMAAVDRGDEIRIIQLDAPIRRLLEVVPEFPSAEGGTPEVPLTISYGSTPISGTGAIRVSQEGVPAPTGQRQVGTNSDGNPLFEDQRGVRSYVKNGVRVTESVGVVATRDGPPRVSVNPDRRGPKFQTEEERGPEPAGVVSDATETPEFRRWFRDSKVVDSDGNPMVVWHGSPARDFTGFDKAKINKNDPDAPVRGFWFSESEYDAESAGRFPWGRPNAPDAQIRPFYLSIKNPASRRDVSAVVRDLREQGGEWDTQTVTDELKRRGFDGYQHIQATRLTAEQRKELMDEGSVELNSNRRLTWSEDRGIDLYDDRVGGHVTGGWNTVEEFERDFQGVWVAFDPEQIRSSTAAQPTPSGGTIESREEPDDGVQRPIPSGDARAGAEDVQPAASDRGARRAPAEKDRGGAPAVRRPDREGAETPERLPPRAVGEGRGTAGARDTDRVPERQPRAERPAREAARVKGENYRIEPGALAEDRGRVQKARDNIRAIELMREIEAEGRPATRAEQEQLARYVGWGGLKGAFPDSQGKFEKGLEKVGERLRELLTDTEYATARRSLQYAHYTAENVARAMWEAAERLGFDGGKVFEPGMGVGNFAGLMPPDVAVRADYNGLELDHTTARIARLLYPRWGVRQDDFTRAPLPKDTFDLVIGNPPFADIPIKSDPAYPQGFLLHDYFFAKSLDGVRPGGLLIFISSAGTMNKMDASAREYLADSADLVGAIRLPGTAFEQSAGTSVTTDILFLRKRLPDEAAGDRTWTETVEVTLPNKEGKPTRGRVSRYFVDHPEMVLGEEGFFDPLYEGRYGVRAAKDFDLDAALRRAMGGLPENVMSEWQDTADRADIDFGTAERKEGSFYIGKDGLLMQQRQGVGRPVERRGKGVEGGKSLAELERIRALVPVRDALRAVYAADLADDKANAETARKRLNEAYDAFVARFGPINKVKFQYRRPTVIQQESARAEAREEARFTGAEWREGDFDATPLIEQKATLSAIAKARREARERAEKAGRPFDEGSFDPSDMPDVVVEKRENIDPFMDDPESYRLRSIEKHNDQTGEAKKGIVFFENVITREREPEIKSVNDALLWVLNKRGRLDIDEVAQTAGVSESEAIEQLGEQIFRLPGTDNQWVIRDEYLAGNVRRKLRQARAAAERDPSLQRNVDALQAAQPAPLPPSEISANLGMPWLPPEVIEQFGTESLGLSSLQVRYTPVLAQWDVDGDTSSAAALTTWGTQDRAAPYLLRDALNRQDPRIYVEYRDDHGMKRQRLDVVATQAAQEKIREIKERFSDWLWSDPERANRLAELYNEEYNSLIAREYDGSYLTTPGISADWQWRPHQTRVIARIIQSGNTYMAHAVGAGKTSAMIGSGMEMRRLGLVRKPMYVVPNHMLGQFTKEFYEQYPTARIMVADERRFHTDRRKQFIADVANEDLDAVIITHSAFGMIPVSDEFQDGLIQEQIEQYRDLLASPDLEGQENRITRSRIEKQIERLEQRLSGKATKRRDQVFTFEEMGIDFLFVDEAHLFRKLDFATKMSNVKGISPEGSKASFDLFVKSRYLETVNPGRNLVLASGTPVTNTMAELYSVSRYLQPAELRERELEHFDAWAGAFGDTVTRLEQNAAGGYQPVTRFAKFVNVPELSVMVRQVMDVVTSRQLEQYVTRPKLKGGKRQMNLAEKTPELEAYQQVLAGRMEAIAERKGPPKPGDDIILSVINDGRHAAIDMRLVNPALPNNPGSKLNLLVDNVHRIWKETKRQPFHTPALGGYSEKPVDKGPAAQMIFANLGLSGARGFAVPDYIRAELVRRGVPKKEIALIADYKTHVAKQRLFNDMNEGKVRVLIGSTSKMATGVNAQRRLYAVHNLDPLWYPADDEQRNGRILRQGNMNPEVEIHDYSTKGTYDSTMWGLMETKARFIQGFFEGDPSLRDMEDLGEASQYEQAKALTTADPRLIQLTELKQQLEKAERRKTAFDREQYANARRVQDARDRVRYYQKRIPEVEADIARRQDTSGDNFEAKLDGKYYTDRVEFGDLLLGKIDLMKGETREYKGHKIGEIGGFDIVVDVRTWNKGRKNEERLTSLAIAREGDHETDARLSESARGTVQSLEHILRGFESDLARYQASLAEEQRVIREFEPQLGRTFTGQAEIDELTTKVRKLERDLAGTAEPAPKEKPEAAPPAEPGQDDAAIAAMLSEGGAVREGDERFSLREQVLKQVGAVERDLKARLDQVGISDRVAVKLVKYIRRMSDQRVIEDAQGRYAARTIEVALSGNERWALDHEVIHALRDLGVIRPAEWRALSKAAQPRMDEIRRRYRGQKLSEESLVEEAVADTFADWSVGQRQARGFLRTAFDRIRDFLEALGNALRGNGFQSAGDVFRRIGRGEVGRRRGFPGEQPRDERGRFARVFHGSPYVFDEFSLDAIGSGEGAQAFGWGLYFAESPEVAGTYRAANFAQLQAAANAELGPGASVQEYQALLQREGRQPGNLYEVEIPDDVVERMLDWDASLGNPVAKTVIDALRAKAEAENNERLRLNIRDAFEIDGNNGEALYRLVHNMLGSEQAASRYLFEQFGIPGIKYLDQISRNQGEGTRNIVLFDPSLITDVLRNGNAVAPRFSLRGSDFNPERARKALAAGKQVAFDNPESERRWQDARRGAAGQETFVTRIRDRLTYIGQGFSRHFIHLPNTARFSPAREQLRKIEAAPQAAKEDVVRVLRDLTKGMSRADLDLFTRKVVLDDLSFEVEREHELPFGFTPEDVAREKAKVDAVLAGRRDLLRKVSIRNQKVREVSEALVEAGVLKRAQIKNPAYYRHQVLDYARAQVTYAKGTGKKLKTPHWARRMGSRLDINANLLEAEFEWMQKALTDIATARTIEWFKRSDYNLHDDVVAQAKAHNQALVNGLLKRDLKQNGFIKNGRETSPLNEEWLGFRQRIAIGLTKVREALEGGLMAEVPAEFMDTAANILDETRGERSIFPFLAWILDNDLPGSIGAAQAFKAINQRKAWVRAMLGEKYADPMKLDDLVKRGFAPEGYTTWQPDEGNLLFTAKTIPEHTVDRMLERIAAEGAGAVTADELRGAIESVRSMMVVGGPKYQLIIPEELAATLNSIRDDHADGLFDALAATPLGLWKRWVLINPRRVLKYNLNNLSGDLDAIIAGNPRAVRKLPQAIRELYQVMLRGKTPSARYREAVERGVFDSGLTVQEIPDINYLSEFESLVNPPSPLREPGRFAATPFLKIWRKLQGFTWFRENWLRYAAYLDYVERLERGESMRKVGYGAANREMVDAIEDPKDRAALLARELVGDYGAISHFGKGIRRKVIPFYSWMEINTKRYWRFLSNAWDQGIAQGFRTTGIVGATLGVRTTAYLALRMAVLYGLVQLWNNLVMGDDEDKLSAEERARLHLNLGRGPDGEVRTLRFQGALSDFLAWFGFEQAVGVAQEIERGRASVGDMLKEIAKAPVNKVANGITPVITAPLEFLTGRSYWPDVFRPRLIRDRWRELAQLFSVENEYDVIFDRPSRGYTRSIEEAVIYKRDEGELAYNRMKGMAYDWLRREKGLAGSGDYQTPRSKALYDWRQAKKFGDRSAERKAYDRLGELGVTADDLHASVKRAHPLGSVPLKDRKAFLATLTRDERAMLDRAVEWYRETYLD